MRGRVFRGTLALIGLALFLGAAALILLSRAPSLVPFSEFAAGAGGGSAGEPLPPCNWGISGLVVGEVPAERLPEPDLDRIEMSENENMALFVTASPFEGDEDCEGFLNAHGPGFQIAPSTVSTTGTAVTHERPATFVLVLSPQKAGTQMFSLASARVGYFEVHHVNVKNWMGVSPFVAQIFAAVGGVLGPILTVPWWLDRRREAKGPGSTEGEA